MFKSISICYFYIFCYQFCYGDDYNVPRYLEGTYIHTVIESKEITTIVPSSCVLIDPTLTPCRNVRFMKFPKFSAFPFYQYQNEDVGSNLRTESNPQMTPLSWGEYFGFFAPTATITATEINVVTVQDPRIIITYAVKGCKPLSIPSFVNRCPIETSSLEIEEILSTSSVSLSTVRTIPSTWFLPTKTQTVNVLNTVTTEIPGKQSDFGGIHPSFQESTEVGSTLATEPLSN